MVTLLAPLRTEAAAVRLGLRGRPGTRVVRTGAGADRARAVPPAGSADTPTVVGVCGAVAPGLHPGDVVVADALVDYDGSIIALPSGAAADLAAVLAAAGLPARTGTIASTERLARGAAARRALADVGAVAVDLESAALSRGRTLMGVVRAVVDTPDAELLSPATVTGGVRALAALRRAAPVVARWAATVRSLPPNPKEDHAWESLSARA